MCAAFSGAATSKDVVRHLCLNGFYRCAVLLFRSRLLSSRGDIVSAVTMSLNGLEAMDMNGGARSKRDPNAFLLAM